MDKFSVEQKKKEIEVKFRTKEEMATIRRDLMNTISELRKKILDANAKEKVLKNEIRKEILVKRGKTKEEWMEQNASILEQRELIKQNQNLIKGEINKFKEEIKLKRAELKESLVKGRGEIKTSLLTAKEEIKYERQAQKNRIIAIRAEMKTKALDLTKELQEEKIRVNETKLEYAKLIGIKKGELITKQKEFIEKKNEQKIIEKRDRYSRIEDARKAKLELLHKREEKKKQYQEKIMQLRQERLGIKGKYVESDAQRSSELENSNRDVNMTDKNIRSNILEKDAQIKDGIIKKVESTPKIVVSEFEQFEKNNLLDKPKFDSVHFEKEKEKIRGVLLQSVGKDGIKIFNHINRQDSKYQLEKIKIPQDLIKSIEEFQALKTSDAIIDVKEFIKYIEFLYDIDINKTKFESVVVSVVVNLLRGKTIGIFGGFAKIQVVNGFKVITWEKTLRHAEYTLVSLPEEPIYDIFEEVLLDKLNANAVIKISENIAIRKQGDIEFLVDVPFLR